jgi:hypothetical protein
MNFTAVITKMNPRISWELVADHFGPAGHTMGTLGLEDSCASFSPPLFHNLSRKNPFRIFEPYIIPIHLNIIPTYTPGFSKLS